MADKIELFSPAGEMFIVVGSARQMEGMLPNDESFLKDVQASMQGKPPSYVKKWACGCRDPRNPVVLALQEKYCPRKANSSS